MSQQKKPEQQLAEAAAGLAAPPKAAPPAEVVELGDGRVVRPERFILPDVSGLAVPRRVDRGGEVVSEWMLYLRWQDGRREAIPLPEVLPVGSERIFITPRPPEPPPAMLPGWSAASRAEWLAGSTSMPPDEVCRQLIEGFAKYLDLPSDTAAGTVAMLSCWSLLTYLSPGLPAVPYVSVSGPMGSGKSRILELLQQVVFRPLLTSSTSEAAIFRSLHAFGHTADAGAACQPARRLQAGRLCLSMRADRRRADCHATLLGLRLQGFRGNQRSTADSREPLHRGADVPQPERQHQAAPAGRC